MRVRARVRMRISCRHAVVSFQLIIGEGLSNHWALSLCNVLLLQQ